MRILLITFLTISAFLIFSIGEASSRSAVRKSGDSARLDPVVITSSGIPVELSRYPSSVTVLDEEYIDSRNTDNLADIMRLVPGLYIDQSAGMAGTSSVYLRGGDPNFTLVLIDGIRVNDPGNSRGGSFDLTTISTANIEMIEIIRAPLSAVYGSDALSGVINIITKKGSRDFHNVADASVSSDGGYRMLTELGNTVDGFNYSFSASYHDDGEPVDESSFRNFSLISNLGYLITDSIDLTLVSRFSSTKKERFPDDSGGPEFAEIREREHSDTDHFSSGLKLNIDHSNMFRQEIAVDLFYSDEELESPGVAPGMRDPAGVPPRREDSSFFRSEFKIVNIYSPSAEAAFSFGLNTVYEDGQNESELIFDSPVPANFKLDRFYYAVFGEAVYSPADGLDLTAGLRLDIVDDYKNEFSPRLDISYDLTRTTRLKFSYGEGFKLPSFFALGSPVVGNDDLKPESGRSFDFGVVQRLFADRLQATFTLFYNDFENLVDLQEEPELRLVNRSNVTTRGVEFEVFFTPAEDVSISGNLSYVNTDIEETDEELRNRPEWLANVILNWRVWNDMRLFVNGNYTGEVRDSSVPTGDVRLDGYFRLDSSVTYRINRIFEGYLSIENILDRDYQQFVGFDAPGIRPTAGLRGYL